MTDYEKTMLHLELALRRACDALRKKGETNIEDALWSLAGEIATLAEETRLASPISSTHHRSEG
jgi:hypothetical protein